MCAKAYKLYLDDPTPNNLQKLELYVGVKISKDNVEEINFFLLRMRRKLHLYGEKMRSDEIVKYLLANNKAKVI